MDRSSGILLHITSLPSRHGIGDFGPGARAFVDFLADAQQRWWQILPLNPTEVFHGNSPYSSASAFAINPLLISPDRLVEDGFLNASDVSGYENFKDDRVDYAKVTIHKYQLLDKAYQNFKAQNIFEDEFFAFVEREEQWLHDYACFVVIKHERDAQLWTDWPEDLKRRMPEVLNAFSEKNADAIQEVKFIQFLAFRQWHQLKQYCGEKGVGIIGDMPIYVNEDSVDVWTHPEVFKLDEHLKPYVVAGVPPDYFSETGQRWGNPVYDWTILKETNFEWWLKRMQMNLSLFDVVRIDHFRGLVQYWEVPAAEKTAMNGYWEDVPTEQFLDRLKECFNPLPIIAEDLGFITDDVRKVIHDYQMPGMKILLFAFNGDMQEHPYLPHNYEENYVAYTGTHDNNTVCGWFAKEASAEEKENFLSYQNGHYQQEDPHWRCIEMAMTSRACIAMIPLQDVLGLGQKSRMNKPGTAENNWEWRVTSEQLSANPAKYLSQMTSQTDRCSSIAASN